MMLFIGVFTLSLGDNVKNITIASYNHTIFDANVSDPSSVLNANVTDPSSVLNANVSDPSSVLNANVSDPYSVLNTNVTDPYSVLNTNVTDPSSVATIINMYNLSSSITTNTNFTTNNVSYPPPSSNNNTTYRATISYCSSQISLQKQTINCPSYDVCCRILIYEDQFTKEENNCKLSQKNSGLCNNLKSCKATCKIKVPSTYSCVNRKSGYNQVLDSCYENCFYKGYNCLTSSNSKDKTIGTAEIIILVILLSSFVGCLCRYTFCKDFYIPQRRPSSKIYSTNTDSDLLHV